MRPSSTLLRRRGASTTPAWRALVALVVTVVLTPALASPAHAQDGGPPLRVTVDTVSPGPPTVLTGHVGEGTDPTVEGWRPGGPSGTIDAAFGSAGVTELHAPDLSLQASVLSADADGRLLVAGTANVPTTEPRAVVVARLLADGTPDPTFGLHGSGVSLVPVPHDVTVSAVRADAALRPVVAGTFTLAPGADPGDATEGFVLRLTGDGAPDPDHGEDGDGVVTLGGGTRAHRVSTSGTETVVGGAKRVVGVRCDLTVRLDEGGTVTFDRTTCAEPSREQASAPDPGSAESGPAENEVATRTDSYGVEDPGSASRTPPRLRPRGEGAEQSPTGPTAAFPGRDVTTRDVVRTPEGVRMLVEVAVPADPRRWVAVVALRHDASAMVTARVGDGPERWATLHPDGTWDVVHPDAVPGSTVTVTAVGAEGRSAAMEVVVPTPVDGALPLVPTFAP
jgi:hypothetical protein